MEQVTLRGFLEGKFTRQQYFDFVCTKLLEQGKPCVDEDGSCVYNGPNGMHCGIGWTTIGDQVLESENVRGLLTGDIANHDEELADGWVMYPGLPDEVIHREEDFLTRVQRTHDDTATLFPPLTSSFRDAFRSYAFGVADDFNLDASVLADGARE